MDTSVWSEALRRRKAADRGVRPDLEELIHEGRTVLLGPIRQELLSGLRSDQQFKRLRDGLRAFPDFPCTITDFEEAASCFNRCRAKGIQGSNTDFLLCGVSLRHGFEIFTTDKDFLSFGSVLPVKLYKPRFPAKHA